MTLLFRGQERPQAFQDYRLANVVVHAGREALLTVAGHGMSGHGDDIGLGEAAVAGADTPSCFVAIHFGHLAVHQNDVVMGVIKRVQDR